METIKVLAQSAPAAATLTDIYTVPASTSTVVSSIVVANRSAGAVTFRISVAVAGAADANQQYLAFDRSCPANDTVTLVLGITLATTDVIRVRNTTADLSFNVFGVQVT